MHPKNLKIQDYSYHLPAERIAQFPLEERDASKLLVYRAGTMQEDTYRNIDQHLAPQSLMVFNQTKVIQVRLYFKKVTGGVIEIFCLEPDERYPDMQTAMSQKGKVYWQCLIGGAQKWKDNASIFLDVEELNLRVAATIEQKKDGYFVLAFDWQDDSINFAELLHVAGRVPLPPYMQRAATEADKDRYQTIYAREEGSVAAPTAGLHFTPRVFDALKARDIHQAYLTLHVGAGTFKQVKSDTIGGHDMHSEWIEVELTFIQQLRQHLGSVVAVGTTSLRTLESLYWIGLKLHHGRSIQWEKDAIQQWEPYELEADISAAEALDALIDWMKKTQKLKIVTRTQILIAPGYRAKIAQSLVTNFHQPDSTLLLLIAALIGEDWKAMYDYALQNDFRFLSYGDGCLLHFG